MKTFTPLALLILLCQLMVVAVPLLSWLAPRPLQSRSARNWFAGLGLFALGYLVAGHLERPNAITSCALVLALLVFCDSVRMELAQGTLWRWPVVALYLLYVAAQAMLDVLGVRLVLGAPLTSLGLVFAQVLLLHHVLRLRKMTGSKGMLIVALGTALMLAVNGLRGALTAIDKSPLPFFALDWLSSLTIAVFTLAAVQFTLGYLVYTLEKTQKQRIAQAQAFALTQARHQQAAEHARQLEQLVAQRDQMILVSSRFHTINSLSLYSSGLVHDVNNPLQVLLLELDNLRFLMPEHSGQAQAKVDRLVALAQKISKVMEGLHQLMTHQPPALQDFELPEVLHELGPIFDGEARRRRLCLRMDPGPGGAPLKVRAHKVLLERVLINLVTNAMQALEDAPAGAGLTPPTVQLSLRQELRQGTPWAVLQVEDNGPGFADALLQGAASSVVTTKQAGMGVGLYLARVLVESWNGRLGLSNRPAPEAGARVQVALPLQA